jgi:putative membrane protein
MKHFSFIITLFSLVVALQSCAPTNLTYHEAQQRNLRKLETEAQRQDSDFLVEAANYDLLFTDISSRAMQEGYARVVTDFANTANTDYQRMHEDLKKLAKDKKMSLPTSMSDRFEQTSRELVTTDRRAFDKNYLNTMETLHERAIRLYEDAALRANDSDIRAFAAAKLDIIRAHERRADELENQLL